MSGGAPTPPTRVQTVKRQQRARNVGSLAQAVLAKRTGLSQLQRVRKKV